MNRRSFFSTLAKASAGFMILPGAGRIWKATTIVPDGLQWRSNSLGIMAQLRDCGKMIDPSPVMNLEELGIYLKALKRMRAMDRSIVEGFCYRVTADELKGHYEHSILS